MSKVEVNQVTQQCGTTLTVGGGACKTAVVDATTVTLGRCGGTVSLASGATQSGFGRTGTVDWITTPKVTGDSPVTGVTGKGYFLNTTAGTITLNLPAGAAGSIVSMADYAATWQTNNVTVSANGSEKIGGSTDDATLSTEGQSVTFVYVDSTQGWVNTMDSTSNVRGINPFIVATGGNQPTAGGCIVCTNYKQHTFTGPGTLVVVCAGTADGANTVDYMVVAGGGGAGGGYDSPNARSGGGGGAGGYRESPGTASGCYTVSPLGVSPAVALPVSATPYPIAVGGGGVGGHAPAVAPQQAANGSTSSFATISSNGGGFGGSAYTPSPRSSGNGGGSGGGGSAGGTGCTTAGPGNCVSTTPPQGNPGGGGSSGPGNGGSGGGGALTAGSTTPCGGTNGSPGGNGATSSINATPTSRAGGGGGGGGTGTGNNPGSGGGGVGGNFPNGDGGAGTINAGAGGGGGAGGPGTIGGGGGSGIVIIRYKFQ